MQNRGEEFIKNLKAKQEKEELEKRLKELSALDTSADNKTQEPIIEEEIVDLPAQELGDILLSDTNEPIDKKKYIILGLALVVLFVITIVVIRIISSPDDKKTLITKTETNAKVEEKVSTKTDIQKQYQEIIDQKLQKIKEKTQAETKALEEEQELDLDKIQKYEQNVTPPKITKKQEIKTQKQDIFEITKKVQKEPKIDKKPKIEKKQVVKKPLPIKKIKKALQNTSKPKGYYIQIGAFSKKPSAKILNNIAKYGFTYTLYNVKVKNKNFTKVLIGSYKNRKAALKDLKLVKSLLSIKGAFIVSFK
jgi:DedD protein